MTLSAPAIHEFDCPISRDSAESHIPHSVVRVRTSSHTI
uniref:Uncharacterized protein n=1 Tax=Parascaris univalens TaxID=6257 RepID=A0A915ARZ9_PARUN